jgi:HJR/Mrr/RecB family endonuclease
MGMILFGFLSIGIIGKFASADTTLDIIDSIFALFILLTLTAFFGWVVYTIYARRRDRAEALQMLSELQAQTSADTLQRTRTLQDAHGLSPQEFEGLVKTLFESMGYIVETTRTTRDEGIDLVLRKSNKLELVQCKRYQGNVGVIVVREFFGVMIDKNVTKGYIVTTGHFTMSARQFARGKGIHLIDGPELAEMLGNRTDSGLSD